MEQGLSNIKSLTGNLALDTVVSGLLTLIVCYIAIRIVKAVLGKALGKASKLDTPVKNLITKAVTALLWAVTIIIVAGAFGINATSLVALLSVVGLALSMSVQGLLGNFFSGIMLLIGKPTVKNYSREPLRRVDMTFCTSYDASTEDAKKAILEAIAKDERILADPAPFVRLGAFKDSVVEYIVRVWCKNADYWDVHFDLNENVRESFAANGVAMSYEHINVHMIEK